MPLIWPRYLKPLSGVVETCRVRQRYPLGPHVPVASHLYLAGVTTAGLSCDMQDIAKVMSTFRYNETGETEAVDFITPPQYVLATHACIYADSKIIFCICSIINRSTGTSTYLFWRCFVFWSLRRYPLTGEIQEKKSKTSAAATKTSALHLLQSEKCIQRMYIMIHAHVLCSVYHDYIMNSWHFMWYIITLLSQTWVTRHCNDIDCLVTS